MKPSGVGGMAVMEGVMMKNKEEYAVAVRKPNNEIAVEKSTHKDFSDKVKLFKLPVFRGMLAFIDSMVIGVKVLNYSASFFEEDEDETQNKKKKDKSAKKANKKTDSDNADFEIEDVSVTNSEVNEPNNTENNVSVSKEDKKDDSGNALMMIFAVLISVVISVSLFMVLPVLLTNLLKPIVDSRIVMNLIEGVVRLAIFIGYVLLASKMPEIKRTFMYHGAEHKTINCLENGFELTVDNVKRQSKQHKRCGTSFMLLVIIISLIFFLFIPTGNLLWRVLSRIVLVPFIAGVSYEFIRLAGKNESKIVDALSQPGLWMQGLTTKEPDDDMIEVAIASVGAVFDWRAFLETDKGTKKVKNVADKKQSAKSKQDIAKNASTAKQADKLKQADNAKKTDTSKQADNVKKTDASKQADNAKKADTSKQADNAKQDNTSKQTTPKHADAAKHENTLKHEIQIKSNTLIKGSIAPAQSKTSKSEEEDDEILRALDKFFDDGTMENKKVAEGK